MARLSSIKLLLLKLRQELAAGRMDSSGELPVSILQEDGSAYAHPGKLAFTDISVDPATGSVLLRVEVPNPDHLLLPGMYVRAEIGVGRSSEALLAPQPAIQRDPKGGAFALIVGSDGKVARREVQVSRTIGNRWAILPMEGWDGTTTGAVTEPMIRRWQRFGESGAKLIWGGEAMAVRPDGRANGNQLILNRENQAGIAGLRDVLLKSHREMYPGTEDPIIGFQLTHSGRFCRPHDKSRWESLVAFRHPILDKKFNVTSDKQILTDDDLKRLVEDYVAAARIAVSRCRRSKSEEKPNARFADRPRP